MYSFGVDIAITFATEVSSQVERVVLFFAPRPT
jgi:hypothetical protein